MKILKTSIPKKIRLRKDRSAGKDVRTETLVNELKIGEKSGKIRCFERKHNLNLLHEKYQSR